MATYIYDDTTMTTVIEAYKTISDLTSSTSEATQSALQVISTIASAGGDLGAEVGGTVLGNLRKASNSVSDALGKVKKVYSTFETAREILNKTSSYISGDGIADTINKLAGMSREEQGELFVDAADFIGDTLGELAGDKASKDILGNVGDMASAIVEGSHIQDGLADYYLDRHASGELSLGEALSGTLSGGVTNGVITIADAVANAVNLDIPDHWNEAATYAVADFGESAYRSVANGVSTGWDYLKSGWDTRSSAISGLFR